VTAADPGGESRARVISCLVASVPGLGTAAAQRVLAAARADDGRALREVEVLLKEHPGALVITPAAYPLALVRLAHVLIEAGYPAVAAPACTGCSKVTADLRRKTASGRVCGTCAARGSTRPVLRLLPGRDCGLLGLRGNQAVPADHLGQPDLPHLPDTPSPAVLLVRARPPGPGGMARRASLRRLL
jgi:hypothetical protein